MNEEDALRMAGEFVDEYGYSYGYGRERMVHLIALAMVEGSRVGLLEGKRIANDAFDQLRRDLAELDARVKP